VSGDVPPVRVVLADDHPFYRKGLARGLAARGIAVVAEAPDGGAAVRAVEETKPDVVVMDLNMPTMSGVEATRRLTEERPDTRVLVLTVSANESDLTDAVVAGACGYVLKDRPVEEVAEAIRAAAAGETRISPQLAMPLLRRLREPSGIAPELSGVALDPPEARLLALVAEGAADEEMAETLAITPAEVRSLAAAILAKLGPRERVQAVLRAAERRRP